MTDCQKAVKEMFSDNDFREKINMSGVNLLIGRELYVKLFIIFIVILKLSKKQILPFQQVTSEIFTQVI